MRIDDPQAVLLNQPETIGPGRVAILCSDAARYSLFWISSMPLAAAGTLPPGSDINVYQGSDVAGARNQAIEELLAADAEKAGWIFFIDDDHAFEPDIVLRLLARGVDVVQALCLRRVSPFWPVATGLDGNYLKLKEHAANDLVEVMLAGSSGMLIRRKALEAVEPPWFELGNGISEDAAFCQKAAAQGIKIHVDTAVRIGHISTATIYPMWDDNREGWITGFSIADGSLVAMEVVDPPPLEEGEIAA